MLPEAAYDTRPVDICFVYFRSLTLQHLDAAWYSLSRQDFSRVAQVNVLDNNTDDSEYDITQVLARYRLPVPIRFESLKHGRSDRAQSWSVNYVCREMSSAPLVFFTRADYILDFDIVRRFHALYEASRDNFAEETFITSHAYHMAYDERGDQRIEGFRDIEIHGWREKGPQTLLTDVNGWRVDSSDTDAGVWLTRRSNLHRAGWMDERLSAWGYQQTVFQKRIKETGTKIIQIPEYLFFHQHHAAPRSYDIAKEQLAAVEKLDEVAAFRPDVLTHTGNVCDELDRKE